MMMERPGVKSWPFPVYDSDSYYYILRMKKILLALMALVIIGCGTDSVTGTFCYQKRISASDVYGTGQYTEYKTEFEKQTGCQSMLNCTAYVQIQECVDGTFTAE